MNFSNHCFLYRFDTQFIVKHINERHNRQIYLALTKVEQQDPNRSQHETEIERIVERVRVGHNTSENGGLTYFSKISIN